ncbi:MAG: SpaA isopeptide-forming pilin-related protein, partial [Bacillota bacterium]|nr:SpaA isopeptide-forming pilin-related protein [Bacillota bacterium]
QKDDKLIPVANQYHLLKPDEWKHTFVELEGDISQYVVKELCLTEAPQGDFQIDGRNYVGVEEGGSVTFDGKKYTVNYSEKSEEGNKTVTITNSSAWQIVKVSKNLGTNGEKLKLEGAEFTAYIVQDDSSKLGTSYYGRSEKEGVVKWYETYDSENKEFENPLENLPSGNKYLVIETKAPSGYQVGEYSWEIDLTGNTPIVKCDNSTIQPETEGGIITYYFENTLVYNLPSTGGNGIFQYIISGVLLMSAAGILMLYRMKRKGVLKS